MERIHACSQPFPPSPSPSPFGLKSLLDPSTSEERELVENLFDCLCTALLPTPDNQMRTALPAAPDNQTRFLKAEGVELMVLTLREGKYGSRGALKTLDYALQRNAVVCERFVDCRGLGALFPFVGGTATLPLEHVPGKAEREALQREDDEHLVGVLCSLCHELEGTYRRRLLGKFLEGGLEKAKRMIALRAVYVSRVRAFVERYRLRHGLAEGGDEADEDEDEELFMGRLEAGLLTAQLATTVLAYLIVSGDPALSKQTLLLLHESGVPLREVTQTLAELRDSMGEESGAKTVTNNRRKMEALCQQLDRLAARLIRRPTPAEAAPADA
jgi:beta-catenin-like protein 1